MRGLACLRSLVERSSGLGTRGTKKVKTVRWARAGTTPRSRAVAGREGSGRRGGHPGLSIATNERFVRFGNDPSAGSPTETLLRLLLPLNEQVQTSFQHVSTAPRRAKPRPIRGFH